MKPKNNNRAGQLLLFPGGDPDQTAVAAPVVGSTLVNLADGRDELNLAEFPLACLTSKGSKAEALTFSDIVFDRGASQPVTRTLTILGAATLGLPTATDTDVLLGLLQFTRWQNGFSDRTVTFSRHELLRLLRWQTNGGYYKRLAESLTRWVGVTLLYDRAWWDKQQKSWVNERFHIFDKAEIREQHSGTCSVTWSEPVFCSFQAENLKRLDLKLYFDLELPTSRRLYRFLDKRFYQRSWWGFHLRALACEHIGLSREYHNGELRRKLSPAIRELESIDFLEPLSESDRFQRVSNKGDCWRIVFVRRPPAEVKAAADAQSLASELVRRGVTEATATALVEAHPAERILVRIDIHDWLKESGDRRAANPAGYLVQSIRDAYEPPPDYQPAAAREAVKAKAAEKQQRQRDAIAAVNQRAADEEASRKAPVAAYLDSLTESERRQVEDDSVANASNHLRTLFRGTTSPMMQTAIRRAMLEEEVARILAKNT